MNPEEMSDEELCLAVGVEVLPHLIQGDEGCIEILSPDGREAIEQELERRGWGWSSRYPTQPYGKDAPVYNATVYADSDQYNCSGAHCRYKAIAIAALKAVRGGA